LKRGGGGGGGEGGQVGGAMRLDNLYVRAFNMMFGLTKVGDIIMLCHKAQRHLGQCEH